MGFSIKKLFSKEKPEDQKHAEKQASGVNEIQPSEVQAEKKKKHGDPGICCGSCSS